MTKRFFIKIIAEISEYDEKTGRLKDTQLRFEPATGLTPDPVAFVALQAASIQKILQSYITDIAEVGNGAADQTKETDGQTKR